MKDKKRKYDLSYFIKDGGRAKDTSPSVNASEMNEEEMKRRNNNLNAELAELDQNEINIGPENPELPVANQQNEDNNNNNNNNGNGNIAKPGQSREELQINSEIAQSEDRLNALVSQFALESHRNREKVDMTPVDIEDPSAAAEDARFAVNNKRRRAQEETLKRQERRLRAFEKAGLESGLENESASRFGEGSSFFNRGRAAQPSSASQKALTKNEMIDLFFEFVATSDKANLLTKELINQFSQNPLSFISWARETLLTKSQRKGLNDMSITDEQLLSRLPENLRRLFEQIRSEMSALEQLRGSRLRLKPVSKSILRLRPIQPEEALQVPFQEKPDKVPPVPVSPVPVEVPNIMVNTHGVQLPPNHKNNFNVKKTQIKNKNNERLSIKPVIKKKKTPENIRRQINNEAKMLSNQANQLSELHKQKLFRNREKIISRINEFKNLKNQEYIQYILSELKDETDKPKIIGLMFQLEKLIKEKEKEKEKEKRTPVNLNKENVIVKTLKAIEKKNFNDKDVEKITELIDELGTLNKIENKDRVNEILEKLQYYSNSYKPSKYQLELEKIQLNKIYGSKAQFISKIKKELEKYEFKNRTKKEIEELIQKIDSLKEENSSQILELMRKLTQIIDKKEKRITNKWLKKTSRLVELSKNGPIQLKSLTIPELKQKIKETPEDQKEEIDQLTSMIKNIQYEKLQSLTINELKTKLQKTPKEKKEYIDLIQSMINKLEKEQEKIRQNVMNEDVSGKYKTSTNILIQARKNKMERNEKKRKEKEEKERIEKEEIIQKELEKIKKTRREKTKRELEKGKIIEEQDKQDRNKQQFKATKEQIKQIKPSYMELSDKKKQGQISQKESQRLTKIEAQLKSLAQQKTLLETRITESADLIKQLREERTIDPEKQLKERRQKHDEIIEKIIETHKKYLEAKTRIGKSQLNLKKQKLFQEIENDSVNSPEYLSDVIHRISKILFSLTEEKHSQIIDELFKIHQKILDSKNRTEKLELGSKRKELFNEIEKNSQNNHEYLKGVREVISKGLKKLNLQDLKAKHAELFTKSEEMVNSNNSNRKVKLKKEVNDLLNKLRTDSDYDKKNIKMLINKHKNFVNSKEIEYQSKKFKKNIENNKKQIQEKYNKESEEKNLFKRYLKSSLSLVDEKNKAELQKVYKKLSTPGIKNSPKTKIKLQELFNKFKKIEENKVKKVNRTTNELATPELPKDTPPFFQKVQRFAPKPVISPWAKKDTKNNSSSIVTNTVKPTEETFTNVSSKRKEDKSYKNALGTTKKALLISPPQGSQNSSPIKKNSNFIRVPYKNEEKIIKLIKKLPSRIIKIKDIKSKISSIPNKEIQRQLRSLLDQKLNSITRK
jgi:hypothetical protein